MKKNNIDIKHDSVFIIRNKKEFKLFFNFIYPILLEKLNIDDPITIKRYYSLYLNRSETIVFYFLLNKITYSSIEYYYAYNEFKYTVININNIITKLKINEIYNTLKMILVQIQLIN